MEKELFTVKENVSFLIYVFNWTNNLKFLISFLGKYAKILKRNRINFSLDKKIKCDIFWGFRYSCFLTIMGNFLYFMCFKYFLGFFSKFYVKVKWFSKGFKRDISRENVLWIKIRKKRKVLLNFENWEKEFWEISGNSWILGESGCFCFKRKLIVCTKCIQIDVKLDEKIYLSPMKTYWYWLGVNKWIIHCPKCLI